jgi:hypothetical protein
MTVAAATKAVNSLRIFSSLLGPIDLFNPRQDRAYWRRLRPGAFYSACLLFVGIASELHRKVILFEADDETWSFCPFE